MERRIQNSSSVLGLRFDLIDEEKLLCVIVFPLHSHKAPKNYYTGLFYVPLLNSSPFFAIGPNLLMSDKYK